MPSDAATLLAGLAVAAVITASAYFTYRSVKRRECLGCGKCGECPCPERQPACGQCRGKE